MDLRLIRRCQAGDEVAFEALFHQYKNLVYKTAYLMLESRKDAEDALQEIFLKVHQSLSSYQPAKGAFTTWLHRITVNYCLNRRRKRRFFLFSLDLFSATLRWEGRSPEDQVADQALEEALGKLSDKLRVVVILRYYHELPYAEISTILDVPVGTVKSRLNSALKKLRLRLGDELEGSTLASMREVK
jgi:RNA polymerase sigma-70 factor (ECF subfamily)